MECTFEILDMVAVDSAEGRFQDTVDATSISTKTLKQRVFGITGFHGNF